MEPKEVSKSEKEEANEEVQEATEEAEAESKEVISEPAKEAEAEHEKIDIYETRIRELEDRLVSQEGLTSELRQAVESKAASEHSHPLPGHVQTIADALAEMDSEERIPEHSHFLYRKVGR